MIRVSSYTLVACRSGRDEECDHWFGLYKITSQYGIGSYWYATTWYGGFLSSYRWWAPSYPSLRYALCFVYTAEGWKDAYCDEEHCFTCKKCPGTNRYDTTRGAVLARARKPTRVSLICRTASLQSSVLQPFNGLFSRTTWVSRYQKGKPVWILLEQETVSGSGISWAICKSGPRSRQITTPVPHHSVFYRPDALPAAQPTASKH